MTFWKPLALVLALVLAGCGDDEAPATEAESPPADGETVQATPAEGASTTAEEGTEEEATADDVAAPSGEAASEAAATTAEPSPAEAALRPDAGNEAEVERILEETERRFEEARHEIDAQFEAVERQAPEAPGLDEALSDEAGTSDLDSLQGASDPEVEAILEETERRFEEASRRIDEQFEQAEQAVPSEIRATTTVDDGDGEGDEAATP